MIPGVTDRNRLPRLGKIRLGEKRQSKGGKDYPAALDHFNLTDIPEVEAIYGKDAKVIEPVMLPHDDEDVFFPTARAAYRASGLFCKCSDGETATRVFDPKDEQGSAYIKRVGLAVKEGDMFEMPCPGMDCPFFENKFCKNLGRLMLLLPKVPRFGVYEIATSSFNSMVNVLNVARAVKNLTGGKLAGIPFALVLKPVQVQPDGKAKTVHVLDLEFRGTLLDLARRGKALGAGTALAGLLPENADAQPDDLYPQAGNELDAALSGADGTAKTAGKAAVAPALMPKRKMKPAAAPEPEDGDEPSAGTELELTPDDLPGWAGLVKSVENKSGKNPKTGQPYTLYTIATVDGPAFGSFDDKVADFAAKALKAEKRVRIISEDTKFGPRVQEITFA